MKKFIIALGLSFVVGLPQSVVAFQDTAVQPHVKLIPSSAFAAVFAQPKAALQTPAMELLPREVITAMGTKHLGFDPCEITHATLIVEQFEDLRQPPGFALILKSEGVLEPNDELTGPLEEGELNGKTIFRGRPDAPAVYLPNQNTIVVGMEPFIEKMIGAKGAESELLALIRESKSTAHLSAFVTIAPIRELIQENLPPEDQVPPPLRSFLELPELLSHVVLETDYTNGETSRLKIGAVDDAAAGKVERMLRQSVMMGKQIALGYVANEMKNQEPELQQSVQLYGERVATYLDKKLRPQREGDQLLFELDGAGQLGGLGTTGVLVGMLLPAVQQVREAARRTTAMNRLRQMALGTLNYESAHGKMPGNIMSEEGEPLLSWRVKILPYMEQNALYEEFHLDEPWDSPHNIELLDRMPEIYQSPNFTDLNRTIYLGFSGEGTLFGDEEVTIGDISDGTSNTVLCVEADLEMATEWTRPDDIPFDETAPLNGLGNLRLGGFNAVFCDGSVHFISRMLDPETMRGIVLYDDGEVVGEIP